MPDDTIDQSPSKGQRDGMGRFIVGPGRKLGSRNKISNAALKTVKDLKDDILAQFRMKIAEGDWRAIALGMAYILPKDRTIEFEGLTPSDVASMLANAEISPEEAKNVAFALAKLAEVGELQEIREKLVALEELMAKNGARRLK